MNRNLLKIIAFISMVIDHIGDFLLNGNIVCKIIGRISFPIFAYFIAEGMKHTKSRKMYFLKLLIFACISQIPYMLLIKTFKLNIMFTFLISMSLIVLIEKFIAENIRKIFLILLGICLVFCDVIFFIDYGFIGVLITVLFYFVKQPLGFVFNGILILLIAFKYSFWGANTAVSILISLVSILSLILLLFYNKQRGKYNLKYLFYVGYPTHLFLIWFLGFIV